LKPHHTAQPVAKTGSVRVFPAAAVLAWRWEAELLGAAFSGRFLLNLFPNFQRANMSKTEQTLILDRLDCLDPQHAIQLPLVEILRGTL